MRILRRQLGQTGSSLALVAFVGYAAIFGLLYDAIGGKVGALSLAPVVIAAWSGGLLPGLVAATCAVLLDLALYAAVDAAPATLADALAYVVFFVAAVAIGRLHEQRSQLREDAAVMREVLRVHDDLGQSIGVWREDAAGPHVVLRSDSAGLLEAEDARAPAGRIERAVAMRDGGKRRVESGRRNFAANGATYRVALARDVTETALALETVRENERRQAVLLAGSTAVLFSVDLAGRLTYVSENAREIFGLSPAEVITDPESWSSRIHPDDLAAAAPSVQSDHATADVRFRRGADWRWIHTDRRVVRDAAGAPLEVIGYATDITDQKNAEARLARAATFDALTGLPNRETFAAGVAERIVSAESREFAVAKIDVDHFDGVNDVLGHDIGDALLRAIGERLRSAQGAGAVARVGGDKFAFVSPDIDLGRAPRFAARLLALFDDPFVIAEHELAVAVSVGVAVSPAHGDTAEALLRRADIALYDAKRTRDAYSIFTESAENPAELQLALLGDLRQALERGQFLLHYQPIVDITDRSVSHVEALLRWRHPVRGLVPPTAFIPLAEQTGLMKRITYWVIEEALRQSWVWREKGIDVGVAVNLSVRNLYEPDLPTTVAQLLARFDVRPDTLTLEITESVLMGDPQRATETLGRLRAMGIRLAVDDFGTGYSSLAYLNRLPIDTIKVDRSFVRDMASDEGAGAIVRATTDLAHTLGFNVVAEGVETEAVLRMLAAYGCDSAQGYYFSRPLPGADLERWLSADALSLGLRRPANEGGQAGAAAGTILVVDDQDVVRLTTQVLLSRHGYRVLQSADLDSAVELSREEARVDVALIDMVMPGTDGIAIAEALRADRPDLAIVFMSGYDVAELAIGDRPFLAKPFTEQSLVSAIRGAVAGVHETAVLTA